jgi:hypothetical protein
VPCAKRAGPSVADVLRDNVAALRLSKDQARAAAHILACRTGRLGGHRAVCPQCHHRHFAYHSCRDRHCPRCGSLDQALWAEAQLAHLLPITYFHLVFTIPASLRPFFAGVGRNRALEALFEAVSETILELAQSQGVLLGILAVLHTWNQKQQCHPHIHCLATGGGLGPQGFVHRQRYLLPLKQLRRVFRGKLLAKLQALLRESQVSVGRYSGHELLRDASRRTWNIDIRRPLAGPEQVIRYFARYTRRISISDKRLVSYDGRKVAFRWRDRSDGNRAKTREVEGATFSRLFLQHVLPRRFVRIRRYGLLSNRLRSALISRCRNLLGAEAPSLPVDASRAAAPLRIFGRDPELCPACGEARLIVVAKWRPTRHGYEVVELRPPPW